jgi:hypothetical protein
MNQQQLEILPYPMFKTTEGEKVVLKEASTLLSLKNSDYFLCCVLDDYHFSEDTHTLIRKIGKLGMSTLTSYLKVTGLEDEQKVELRRIWIRKLLAYSPE